MSLLIIMQNRSHDGTERDSTQWVSDGVLDVSLARVRGKFLPFAPLLNAWPWHGLFHHQYSGETLFLKIL